MQRNSVFNLEGVTMYTIPDFLSDDECLYICNLIEEKHERSSVAGTGTKVASQVDSRTSSSAFLDPKDEKIIQLNDRIAREIGVPIDFGEPLQGQLYEEGQHYGDHCDYFDKDGYINHCLASGQRTWTVMIYLNDVESGGNTEFPRLGKSFKPEKGTAVIWQNSMGSGTENPATLHSGRPVTKGKKMIITKWFREKKFQPDQDAQLAKNHHKKNEPLQILDRNSMPVKIDYVNGIPHARYGTKENIPRITKEGFQKIQIPKKLYQTIFDYYLLKKQESIPEFDPKTKNHLSDYIQSSEVEYPTEMIPLTDKLKTEIFDGLEDIHKKWSGREIHRTHCYGIRTYFRGSVLKKHTDGFETRVISAILNIDQKVDQPWPLQIEDHKGKEHEVFLEAGEMCLYESAVLMHGRVKPLVGDYFTNVFVHFVNLS